MHSSRMRNACLLTVSCSIRGRGVYPIACWDTQAPVKTMKDRCKTLPYPKLRLRAVKMRSVKFGPKGDAPRRTPNTPPITMGCSCRWHLEMQSYRVPPEYLVNLLRNTVSDALLMQNLPLRNPKPSG